MFDELLIRVATDIMRVDLDTARTASAAWKAKSKSQRKERKELMEMYNKMIRSFVEQRSHRYAAEKRVADLEDKLKAEVVRWQNAVFTSDAIPYEYGPRALKAERRVAELLDALVSILDGLDSNYDERCGLTNKEWEQRISETRAVLRKCK